jgi:hypothetical protein
LLALSAAVLSAGCGSAPTQTAPQSSGAAGGATAVGGDASLQTCTETVGTVRLQDGNAPAATSNASSGNATLDSVSAFIRSLPLPQQSNNSNNNANAGVSIEALRLLIQQSNCLAIVDRGISEAASDDEKRRTRSPNSEVRDDANMGQGQEVAADFVLRAMVLQVGTDKSSSMNLGALIPWKAAGAVSVGQTISSADVQLVLSDVRSKIQLAVAQGRGSDSNTGLATSVIGGAGGLFGGGGAKSQTNTSTNKILLQAFADAYNKMVPALKNYKSQMVKGGLGAGGTLKVQGSKGDPSAVQK